MDQTTDLFCFVFLKYVHYKDQQLNFTTISLVFVFLLFVIITVSGLQFGHILIMYDMLSGSFSILIEQKITYGLLLYVKWRL